MICRPAAGRGGAPGAGAGDGRGGASQSSLPATAVLISTGPDEYFIVGGNFSVTFSPNGPGPEQVGLGTVEEGNFVDGVWVPGRHLAGDDTSQGETSTIRVRNAMRVTLYRYLEAAA